MSGGEANPVVLLSEGVWHIVADSRRSKQGLCGLPIGPRQAHSRLRTIGTAHLCPHCRTLFLAEGNQ